MARPAKANATSAVSPPPAPSPALSVPVPAPPEPAVPEPSLLDQFDTAFSEAVAAEVEAAAPPLRKLAPKPAEPKPAQEPVQEPEAEAAPAEPQPPPELPPSPQPQPQPLAPPQPPSALPSQPQPQLQPPPPQPSPAPSEPPLFTAEEATQLQAFYTDWPDVARATETMVRGIVAQTARRMYQDMASSLAPYLHTIDTLADRSQLSELQTQVSDYDAVSGQLSTWAARQPAYLRAAYEHVIKSGTAAEVVDLINRYKQETTPAHTPAPAAAAPPAAPAAPAAVNPALAAAAARLAPVNTKRTNVVAPPTDFDTAFAEFARAS